MSKPASDERSFFDAIAGRYDRVYALSTDQSRLRMQRVLRELPPAPARVLDLGVGTGRELSALLDAGHAPTGLDASEEMLARCARRSRPVPLVHADFWQPLPQGDGSFDAAIALHGTLAHPPDPGALSRLALEVARVVRPGGTWVIEVPAPAWLDHIEPLQATRATRQDSGRDEARIVRTGARTCRYEDLVVGASIEARVLDATEWRAALGDAWTVHVEPLGALEWLVVGGRSH
jgi:ubiquinone/menaquinone biosynthesis C-methylase UbiE